MAAVRPAKNSRNPYGLRLNRGGESHTSKGVLVIQRGFEFGEASRLFPLHSRFNCCHMACNIPGSIRTEGLIPICNFRATIS